MQLARWFAVVTLLSACGRTAGDWDTAHGHATGGVDGDDPIAQTGGQGPEFGAGASGPGGFGPSVGTGGSGLVGGPIGGSGNVTVAAGGSVTVGTGGQPGKTSPIQRCDVPPLPPPADDAARARTALIEAHCAALKSFPCLTYRFGETTMYASSCGADIRASACEVDDAVQYNESVPKACDAAWQAAAKCVASIDYTGACDGTDSELRLQGLMSIIGISTPGYPGELCRPERQALADCTEPPFHPVNGTLGDCQYDLRVDDPRSCNVGCSLHRAAGDSFNAGVFEGRCDGPAGGPFQCACFLNGYPLYDEVVGYNPGFVSATCEDAAVRMSNGDCLERVNCCFDWRDDAGENQCTCVSDPMRIGYDTCDAAAQAKGGMVVKLCSKYKARIAGMP